jgi:hypothetical protein
MHLADFDGQPKEQLYEIAHIAAAEFDRIGIFCEDPVPATVDGRFRWLLNHTVPDDHTAISLPHFKIAEL